VALPVVIAMMALSGGLGFFFPLSFFIGAIRRRGYFGL
jgi:hypothetical protein